MINCCIHNRKDDNPHDILKVTKVHLALTLQTRVHPITVANPAKKPPLTKKQRANNKKSVPILPVHRQPANEPQEPAGHPILHPIHPRTPTTDLLGHEL